MIAPETLKGLKILFRGILRALKRAIRAIGRVLERFGVLLRNLGDIDTNFDPQLASYRRVNGGRWTLISNQNGKEVPKWPSIDEPS